MTTTLEKTSFGDWVVDGRGRLATVSDRAKARQDAGDVVEQGPTVVRTRLTRQIRAAYADLITLQSTYQRSQRTLAERIARVASVRVAPTTNDPTRYVFAVALVTAAGERVATGGRFP